MVQIQTGLLVLLVTVGVGVAVGAGMRDQLGWLRRGVAVGRGPCELGAVAAAVLPVGAVVVGLVPASWAPLWVGVGLLAVAGSVTDLVAARLPDPLTLPALPLLLGLAAPIGVGAVGRACLGAAVFLLAHAGVAVVAPGALGGGDVKLAPALGAALGAGSWWALLAGPVVAAVGVLVLTLVRRRRAVPMGPPALASTWLLVGMAAVVAGSR